VYLKLINIKSVNII